MWTPCDHLVATSFVCIQFLSIDINSKTTHVKKRVKARGTEKVIIVSFHLTRSSTGFLQQI